MNTAKIVRQTSGNSVTAMGMMYKYLMVDLEEENKNKHDTMQNCFEKLDNYYRLFIYEIFIFFNGRFSIQVPTVKRLVMMMTTQQTRPLPPEENV